jgi:hypothetical protein
MDKQEASKIIAQAARALKAAQPTDAPADRIATAKRKVLMDGAQNEAADRNRSELTNAEFTQVVSVNAAQQVAALPERERSPRALDQSEMSALLAQGMAEYSK